MHINILFVNVHFLLVSRGHERNPAIYRRKFWAFHKVCKAARGISARTSLISPIKTLFVMKTILQRESMDVINTFTRKEF